MFECPETSTFHVITNLRLTVRVSMALEGLDVIV